MILAGQKIKSQGDLRMQRPVMETETRVYGRLMKR
jgi:hypothetical protein